MRHRATPQVKARTAIVVGGGIAGTVSAMALRRAGIEAAVYEAREPGSADRDRPLTIAPNGRAALALVGARDVLGEVAMPAHRTIVRVRTGMELTRTHSPDPHVTVPGGALNGELERGAAAEGIEFAHGKRFVDAVDTGRSVIARFDDHTTAEADILIGCDGVRSAVRTSVDPLGPGPRGTGLVGLGGYLTGTGLPDTAGTRYLLLGRRAFLAYQVTGDQCAWTATLQGEHPRAGRRHWIEAMRAAFGGGPASELLARLAPEDTATAQRLEDRPHTPVWSRGRLVLAGDAAHAAPPSSDQGAALAAESAVELARCLRDLPIDRAFKAYRRNRRERVERILAEAARDQRLNTAGPITATIRDLLMPITATENTAWQYDYRIDWEAAA